MAVAAPAFRAVVVNLVDWTPVEIPLDGEGGAPPHQDFGVGRSGKYVLAVRIDRPEAKPAADHAECLLGFDRVHCAGIEPVPIRWAVTSASGAAVQCADPVNGGRFTPASLERWLGCFDAREEDRYAVRVELPAGAGALRPFHPRFLVTASSALDREHQSVTAAVWLTALFAGFAGLLLWSGGPEGPPLQAKVDNRP
jgi:hypothetical protein